jgi:hypothetical protein
MGNFNSLCILAGGLSLACVVATASQFDGTWTSNCYSQTAQGQTQYGSDKMTITDSTMAVDSLIYTESGCSQAIATAHTGGELNVSADSSAPAGAEAADLTLNALTLAINDAQYVDYMNQESFCGYNNWVLNQPQDVLGKNCGGQAMPTAGSISYDIMGFGTDGNLYMGLVTDTQTGTSVQTRPTTLDTSIVYSKINHLVSSVLR